MKSSYIHFKHPVVLALCNYCHKSVIPGASRTVLDDNGSLAITAWTCRKCGSVNEEIGMLAKNGQLIPRPNRYVVVTATVDGGIPRNGLHASSSY